MVCPYQAQAGYPGLTPTNRFFSDPPAPPSNPDTARSIDQTASFADNPSGRPAVVYYGGEYITFLPRFQPSRYDSRFAFKSNVAMFSNKTNTAFYQGLENFPFVDSNNGIDSISETRIDDGPGQISFSDSTIIAATTFRNKIWIAVGGNRDGVPFYEDRAVFDIYTYEADPNSPNYPYGGQFTKIDQFVTDAAVRGVSVASLSNLEQQPGGNYKPNPKLVFFFTYANYSSIVAYPTSDGILSRASRQSFSVDTNSGKDISAVTTVDYHNKPIIALGWSSTAETPQSGMGIIFHDGNNFVAESPVLKGGPGEVGIPTCIRLAAGNVDTRPSGSSSPASVGNRIQVFGRLGDKFGRWEYEITYANGRGVWNNDPKKPAILPIVCDGRYPDNFAAFSSTQTVKHDNSAGVKDAITYYKTTVGIVTWEGANEGSNRSGFLKAHLYPSDQLIPYGVIPTGNGAPVPRKWVTSTSRSMVDPAYSDAWTLLGVFHGVPPSLVGTSPTDKPLEMRFMSANGGTLTYSKSTGKEVGVSSTYTTSVGGGYENDEIEGVAGLEAQFKYELTKTSSSTERVQTTISINEFAEKQRPNTGYMLFLAPAVEASLYRRSGPDESPIVYNTIETNRKQDLYSEVFVGKVISANPVLLPYNMVKPNEDYLDPKGFGTRSSFFSTGMAGCPSTVTFAGADGWNNRRPAPTADYETPPDTHFPLLQVSAGGGDRTSLVNWGSDKTSEESTTVSFDLKASLFGAYTSAGTSSTSSASTAYSTDTTISLTLSYPVEIGRTAAYSVQPYFFRAINVGNCDFVPTKYKSQTFKPFLLTYQTDAAISAPGGPVLTLDTVAQSVEAGGNAQFIVAGRSSTAITYQWYFNDKAMPGQTKRTLTLYKVTAAQAGSYRAVLTDSAGSTRSGPAALEVIGAPIFSGTLPGGTVAPDQDIVLVSKFVGKEPILYQWYLNGLAVRPGAGTGKNFKLLASQISPEGTEVSVVATNALGSARRTTTFTASADAPRNPGSALFAGSGVSPTAYQDLSLGLKTYDIVLLQGKSVTAKVKPGHITRLPFLDNQGELCVVEFSGAGTVTLSLPDGVLVPSGSGYGIMRGQADILITNPTTSTYLAVIPLGEKPATLSSSALLADLDSGHNARIHSLKVDGASMGGINLANACFLGTKGNIGILAPSLSKVRYVYVGDMNALGDGVPNLTFYPLGKIPLVAGGDLSQGNKHAIITSGLGGITFVRTLRPNGVLGTLPTNAATYLDIGAETPTLTALPPGK